MIFAVDWALKTNFLSVRPNNFENNCASPNSNTVSVHNSSQSSPGSFSYIISRKQQSFHMSPIFSVFVNHTSYPKFCFLNPACLPIAALSWKSSIQKEVKRKAKNIIWTANAQHSCIKTNLLYALLYLWTWKKKKEKMVWMRDWNIIHVIDMHVNCYQIKHLTLLCLAYWKEQ